jgi:hypothetical protein
MRQAGRNVSHRAMTELSASSMRVVGEHNHEFIPTAVGSM